MDWSMWLAAVAIVVSLASVWFTRSAVLEARRANDLTEQQQADERGRQSASAEARQVVWRVEGLRNSAFVLRHQGTHEARNVKITSPSGVFTSGQIVDPKAAFSVGESGMMIYPLVRPGQGIKFTMAVSPAVGRGHELHVAWDGKVGYDAVPLPPI